MRHQFFVIRLRHPQDDDLRIWLNRLPAGSRSQTFRNLLRWARYLLDTRPADSGPPTCARPASVQPDPGPASCK